MAKFLIDIVNSVQYKGRFEAWTNMEMQMWIRLCRFIKIV